MVLGSLLVGSAVVVVTTVKVGAIYKLAALGSSVVASFVGIAIVAWAKRHHPITGGPRVPINVVPLPTS